MELQLHGWILWILALLGSGAWSSIFSADIELTLTWSGHETWGSAKSNYGANQTRIKRLMRQYKTRIINILVTFPTFPYCFMLIIQTVQWRWLGADTQTIWHDVWPHRSRGSGARRRLNTDICCDKCFLGWLIITHHHTRSANQPGQMSRVSIVSARGPKQDKSIQRSDGIWIHARPSLWTQRNLNTLDFVLIEGWLCLSEL